MSYLVHNVLQQLRLIIDAETLGRSDFVFEHQEHDRVINGTRAPYPLAPRVQLAPHGLYVFPDLVHDIWIRLQQCQCLARGSREHGGQGGGERVRRR